MGSQQTNLNDIIAKRIHCFLSISNFKKTKFPANKLYFAHATPLVTDFAAKTIDANNLRIGTKFSDAIAIDVKCRQNIATYSGSLTL